MPRLFRQALSGAAWGAGGASSGNSSHAGKEWLDDIFGFSIVDEVLQRQAEDFMPDQQLITFAAATLTHLVIVGMLVTTFSVLRRRYPHVYSYRSMIGEAPFQPSSSFLGWIGASWKVTTDEVIDSAGLDAAMMLEFVKLASKIMVCLGVPMCIILAPLNCLLGDGAAKNDYLGRLSVANNVAGGWLDWVHAVAVWAVVIILPLHMYEARDRFITFRYQWLRALPDLQARTVMVTNIPKELQSDKKLATFFEKILPGNDVVKQTYVIRETSSLEKLWTRLKEAKAGLQEAEATWKVNQEAGIDQRPQLSLSCCGGRVDSLEHFKAQVAELEPLVREERQRIVDAVTAAEAKDEAPQVEMAPGPSVGGRSTGGASPSAGGVFAAASPSAIAATIAGAAETLVEATPSLLAGKILKRETPLFRGTGFVTFNNLLHREIALRLTKLYTVAGQVVTGDAPEHRDVFWRSLGIDTGWRQVNITIGCGLMLMLLIAYTPLVITITNVAMMVSLGPLQPFWNGIAPTLGLTIMISFLPTLLMLIITNFFPLTTATKAQLELQKWYFWFQVFLVLLATSLGYDIIGSIALAVDRPVLVFARMAANMPNSTLLYMNLLVLEWSDDAKQLLRLPVITKYVLWRSIYTQDDAKENAEPEDQDYDGIGARSARHSITTAVGIVYGCLSPPLLILCTLNLMLKRVVFGYLLVFAETRKADLGGVFWIQQMRGVFVASCICTTVMTAVLFRRSGMGGPALLALPAVFYALRSAKNFFDSFSWESLPISDVADLEAIKSPHLRRTMTHPLEEQYIQPELIPD